MNFKSNLVSIIVPVYNMEKYLDRFFECILNQTYKRIQLIVINDGSCDNSSKIIKKKQNILTERIEEFIFIEQENKGVSAAMNAGLSYVQGEYLTWIDPDDELYNTSIEKKVCFLNKHLEYGLVKTGVKYYDCEKKVVINDKSATYHKEEYIYKNIIDGIESIACMRYLLRSKCFFEFYPDRKIYTSKSGQNYQMLLPITYKYKCGFIPEQLCIYNIHSDSKQHKKMSFEEEFNRFEEFGNNIYYSLSQTDMNKERIKNIVLEKVRTKQLLLAFQYNKKEIFKKCFDDLKKENLLTMRLKRKSFIINYQFLYFINQKIVGVILWLKK